MRLELIYDEGIFINSNLNELTKSVPAAEPPNSKLSSNETSLK